MVAQSVKVKEEIVAQDPHEQGIRKALNLGHTVGHAFESFALHNGQQLLHGYAVASVWYANYTSPHLKHTSP